MKKIFKSFIILCFGCAIFSSCMISKPVKEETKRTITVSGNGTVAVSPDLVKLCFKVKTLDWNVSKGVERNAVNSDFVLKALKDNGVDSNDISTKDYTISQDNTNNYPGQYTVTNTIAVIIRNTEITGKVIDAVIKGNAGANGLTSFEYAVTDNTSALRQARTLAIQDAQDAASLLAGASGCKVGSVLSIEERFSTVNAASVKAATPGFGASTNIMPSDINVTSNVTVTFELEN